MNAAYTFSSDQIIVWVSTVNLTNQVSTVNFTNLWILW